MDHLFSADFYRYLQDLDLVVLQPESQDHDPEKLAAARACLGGVWQDFLQAGKIPAAGIEPLDGFLFVFNEPEFSCWHGLNWWEQRRQVRAIRDNQSYIRRARRLLQHSSLAPYINYADEMVAGSTELAVKQAWMRKRLVLQECFWNTIDSISHAAYFKQKYRDMYPALCPLLCSVVDENGKKREFFFGIDNGTGFLYKKKSRDSALFHFLYKAYKFLFRSGVFYIGGLELGLLETDGELSCHGSGAVVYQGW